MESKSHTQKVPSISWRNWNPILSSSIKDLEVTFSKTTHYLIAFPHNRSQIMIAPFTPSTLNPFVPIATWLDNNFNPGTSQKSKTDKEKVVDMWLLVAMEEGKEEDRKVLVEAFRKMSEERVLFLVGGSEIMGTGQWKEGAKMVLRREVGSWLEVGDVRVKLEAVTQDKT